MLPHNRQSGSKTRSFLRSRRGAVAVMALVVVIVSAILFQAYITHVLSDIKAGQTFDTVAQYEGERVAVGNVIKESILQYYECPRFGTVPGSLSTLISNYLANGMATTNVTYTVTTVPTVPSNATSTFWPAINKYTGSGTTAFALDGSFDLVQHTISSPFTFLKNRTVAQYMPDTSDVLAVQSGTSTTGDNVFKFVIDREDANANNKSSVTFTYYVRIFQEPVTDFNLVCYGISDKASDIPDAPYDLPTNATSTKDMATLLASDSIHGICLSKMDASSSITQVSGTASTSYPYMYRELFSSASSLWEYAFYQKTYISQYFPTASSSDKSYVINMSTDPVQQDVTGDYTGNSYADGNSIVYYGTYASSTVTPIGITTTGFTPAYYYVKSGTSYRVTRDGYPLSVTTSGTTIYYTLVTALGGSTPVTDQNSDGYITEADSIAAGISAYVPTKVDWTIDLNAVSVSLYPSLYRTLNSTNYRCIYVKIPESGCDSNGSTTWQSSLTIVDSTVNGTHSSSNPVVLCIEGWSRYNYAVNNTSIQVNYPIYLKGDLTDQQMLIYDVGADLTTESACTIDGTVLLDDRICGLTATGYSLTINGLLAWSGVNWGTNDSTVNLTGVTVNAFPSTSVIAGGNAFRPLAPRFLLVDVQGNTTVN